MKRTLSLLLVICLFFTLCLPAVARPVEPTGNTLRFRDDGSFTILQITDLHKSMDDKYNDVNTRLLRQSALQANPDLVTITGDIAMNGTLDQVIENIDAIMTVFEELSIPVAVVFGNHDSESGQISREDLMAVYNRYNCSVSVDEGPALTGCGTYNLPVLASGSDKVAFNIWMTDSGDYDEEGHYGFVAEDQIQWYVNTSNALKQANNGQPVPSLMFQHIPVYDIYDALKETHPFTPLAVRHIYDKSRYFVLNPENTNAGRLAEYPCPPYYNSGQFDAIVNQGDVLAMFFGHDHSNTFNITHRGVDLVATPKMNFAGFTGLDRGGRIITINENDPWSYQTQLLRFSDLYADESIGLATLLKYKDDGLGLKSLLLIKFYGAVYRVQDFFYTTLLEAVTFTRYNYG